MATSMTRSRTLTQPLTKAMGTPIKTAMSGITTKTARMVLSKAPGAWVAKVSVVGVDKVAVLV